jgi:hypothetical protein
MEKSSAAASNSMFLYGHLTIARSLNMRILNQRSESRVLCPFYLNIRGRLFVLSFYVPPLHDYLGGAPTLDPA